MALGSPTGILNAVAASLLLTGSRGVRRLQRARRRGEQFTSPPDLVPPARDRKQVLEHTISRILRSFVRLSACNLDETLGAALSSLVKLTVVDRCHLVLVGQENGQINWEYQWCAPGVAPVDLGGLPTSLDSLPWLRERVGRHDVLLVKNLQEMPEEASREKELLAASGATALVGFPLFRDGEILGFLLISATRSRAAWDADGIRILSILADAVASVLHRREAERALQAANNRLVDIIAFLPDPTFVIDSERRVVAWNRAMADLTGIPGSEMVGRGDYAYAVPFYGEPVPVLIDHFGDADLGTWRNLYNYVEVSGQTLFAESFVPFLNEGRGAYLWLTASPLCDDEGNIVGAIESLRDVTYRKKAEEALKASEQRFRRLIETMTDGLAIIGEDGIISYANDSLCAMLGYDRLELEGHPVGRYLPETMSAGSLESWPGWQLGCGEGVEMEVARRDGQLRALRLSPAHICDDKGRFAGAMAILSDITPMRQAAARIRALNRELEQKVIDGSHELKATSKALSRSEDRYRRIIESLRDGYIFYSLDPEGNFTYVSPSFRDILGYSRLGIFATRLRQWLEDPRNSAALANAEKSRLGYRQAACDLHVEHRDGTPRILEVQESPVFDRDGKVVSIEGLCRDVTENRRNLRFIQETQQQLLESEKLAALGSLVAGLSHEINTPVGIGVTAASHLVQEAKYCAQAYRDQSLTRAKFEQFLESARESGDLIQNNLNRAADLLQNFKLVATDQTAGQDRTFNLREYLGDVIQSLAPRFRNTGFKVVCNCPDDLEMHCDPGALYQVLSNLVLNSLTHGFEGLLVGEITLTGRRVDSALELVYCDNGNGMTSQELARIYEPFFTTKRGRGGTGLGMHIVYNNVTQILGGSINCASKPGRGTRFIIRVPLLAEVEHG